MKTPKPDYKIDCITEITPDWLKQNDISAILMDLDGTLLPKSEDEVSSNVECWILNIKRHGICLGIVSNSNKKRIEPIALQFDISFVNKAHKPSSLGIKYMICELGLDLKHTLYVGDEKCDAIAAYCAGIRVAKVKTKKRKKGESS